MAAALGQDGADVAAPSQRVARDLAALLALPAMWVDHTPADIVVSLLGVLFGMLRLESAYARFDDPAGGTALEGWRPDGARLPAGLEPARAAALAHPRGTVTISVTDPDGSTPLRVTSMISALPGENGLVLVACRRPEFPTNRELHALRAAVGQAAISIHTARRLASERAARISAEQALRHRNDFLAALAHHLSQPLTALAGWVAQAQALANEPSYVPAAGAPDAQPGGDAPVVPGPAADAAPPARLTRREAEVLGLLAQGLSNREIAAVLWLSERTVERHITSLYRKIDVQRRSEATAYAMRHGIVTSDMREA